MRPIIRRRTMAGTSPSLPYDARLEYLETTRGGDFCVPLGIMADEATDSVEMNFHVITSDPQTNFIISDNNACRVYSNGSRILSFHRAASDQWSPTTGLSIGSNKTFTFNISWKDKTYTINGTTKTFSAPNTPAVATQETVLFDFAGSKKVPRCQIYPLKWRRNGELILDLVPVRKGTLGCLYDNISEKLFYNIGATKFILGPELANSGGGTNSL